MFDNPLTQEVIAEVYNAILKKNKEPDDLDRKEALRRIKEKDSELYQGLKKLCDKYEIISFVKRDNEMKIKGGDSWIAQIKLHEKELDNFFESFKDKCKDYNIDTDKIYSILNN